METNKTAMQTKDGFIIGRCEALWFYTMGESVMSNLDHVCLDKQ